MRTPTTGLSRWASEPGSPTTGLRRRGDYELLREQYTYVKERVPNEGK